MKPHFDWSTKPSNFAEFVCLAPSSSSCCTRLCLALSVVPDGLPGLVLVPVTQSVSTVLPRFPSLRACHALVSLFAHQCALQVPPGQLLSMLQLLMGCPLLYFFHSAWSQVTVLHFVSYLNASLNLNLKLMLRQSLHNFSQRARTSSIAQVRFGLQLLLFLLLIWLCNSPLGVSVYMHIYVYVCLLVWLCVFVCLLLLVCCQRIFMPTSRRESKNFWLQLPV